MLNLQTRTADPALSFHIEHYLDATQAQTDPTITIKQWLELDAKREAAMTMIAFTTGLIEVIPPDGILPPALFVKTLAIVDSHA